MSLSGFPCLSTSELRKEGIPEPWTFGHEDIVRFSELDVLNHVNNAAYVVWLENARISYFVNYGISDYVSENRPTLVVRSLQLDYHAPLHLGQKYIVATRSAQYGRTSWTMKHAIFCDGDVKAEAACTIVTIDGKTGKSVPLNQSLIDTISKRDSAVKRDRR
ncbi:acyl-CoA thioesterase [Pacificoceanicola onchidii]|uniref:acyl-CoA thioesterase n=1 Tax=Pacificoceanicola onchidii TaxID=2562685 RepID=UPI0010A456ED|nr:thioesterase family protein [Pacificoceanicola onchidii]